MNKKILILSVIISIIISPVTAEDSLKSNDWGENSSVFNSGFTGQKPITDNKLKQTIKMLKERNLSKKQKKIQEEVKPLSPASDNESFENFVNSQDPDNQLSQTLTVMIPVSAYSEYGDMISPGYYKLSCRKIAKNEYALELSQGTQKILSVKAHETQQDLEQDSISFCNAEIIDDKRIRLVYGSIDLNLVGYLYINR